MKISLEEIQTKKAKLEEIKASLKKELFGIDDVIDRVVDSIKTWYLMPEIITHPIIINLFGLTGTGKTQLVRALVKKLGFNNKFVEIQMDCDAKTFSYEASKVSSMIQSSSIEEGSPGIIFLDEFQKFRTIDETGNDIRVEKYQDIWQLLSDGKFSIDYKFYDELVMTMAMQKYTKDEESAEEEDEEEEDAPKKAKKIKKVRKYKIYPYEAKNLKKMFKLKEEIEEIMTWDADKVNDLRNNYFKDDEVEALDYSKCLIFVCGNLDEVFNISKSVNDCDTDADVFYEMTKKINVNNIKECLNLRFKPEQIARLGNNIIIYPSLNRKTYEKIIKTTCSKYISNVQKITKLKFELHNSVYDEIYKNSVYPAQGTRPVFSSIHKIFASPLSDCVLWAMENGKTKLNLKLDGVKKMLICSSGKDKTEIPVILDIDDIRAKNTLNFKSLVAVHEAGHAVIYTILHKKCPSEIDINLASFEGGYVMSKQFKANNKKNITDRITVLLAGMVAEEEVFGEDFRSSGCGTDITQATVLAGQYIRRYGFGDTLAFIGDDNESLKYISDFKESNLAMDKLMKKCKEDAKNLLKEYKTFFKDTFNLLINSNKQNETSYFTLAKLYIHDLTMEDLDVSEDYNKMLKDYGK